MKILKAVFPFIIYFFSCFNIYSETTPIGAWRVHLPFNKARMVTENNNKIICGAENGIFIYDKNDNSIESLSKMNGLSDINISLVRFSSYGGFIFIGYENGNIDLMQGKTIYNIPDIKSKSISGSKRINNITFIQNNAYLACDFGLVVLNLEKKEIKDTYYLSFTGNTNPVRGVAASETYLSAATDSGIFQIEINNPNINFVSSWGNITANLSAQQFTHIFWFENKLYVNRAMGSNNEILFFDNGMWQSLGINFPNLRSVQVLYNKIVITGANDVKVFDKLLQEVKHITNAALYDMRDAIADKNDIIWIADNNKGLVKALSNAALEYIAPNGPTSGKATSMQISNGQLWVTHSGVRDRRWDPIYSHEGFSTLKNNIWTTYNETNTTSPVARLDTILDFMSLAIDPGNSDHIFLGSRGKGILEFENGHIKKYFNEFNSTIQAIPNNPGTYWMGGIAFDAENNLQAVNSNVSSPLLTYKNDGSWQKQNFPGFSTTGVLLGDIMLDSYGRIWINVLQQGGIVIVDPSNSSYVHIADTIGLPSMEVRAFTEDKEGQVWIGTGKGIGVMNLPGPSVQKILILQEGSYQYLLETEAVTSIVVDGANRKWIGTDNGGVFLLSSDGTKQLQHFTADNSPLLSNRIYSMALDDKSGEIFFGTERGIISYRSDATSGADNCENTYVYPNPVYSGYSGPIAISGVVNNGTIKITDISGTLIYEIKSLGGQAIWNGKNFQGEKAHTGVYLVFSSDSDGTNTCITKLLFIN